MAMQLGIMAPFLRLNGGSTWSSLVSGTDQTLYSVCFTNNNNGYAVGWYGVILNTTNGGTTWTLQPLVLHILYILYAFLM